MKKTGLLYCVILGLAAAGLLQSGCISISESPSPHFYMPHSITESSAVQKFDFPAGVFIGVGPVRVPEYMNRPQMITRKKDGLLNITQFERWGELVDSAMLRMLDENLIIMLPGANTVKFPWNIECPVKYQIVVDIVQMDSDLDKDLTLVVRWNIFNEKKRLTLFSKRSEIVQPISPHDYFGLNEALSVATARLSSEIAENLSKLAQASHPALDPAVQ